MTDINKVFRHTRKFWVWAATIVFMSVLIGFLIGSWTSNRESKRIITSQQDAYTRASNARKATLDQCLANNVKLTDKLTTLGDKTVNALNNLNAEGN